MGLVARESLILADSGVSSRLGRRSRSCPHGLTIHCANAQRSIPGTQTSRVVIGFRVESVDFRLALAVSVHGFDTDDASQT